MGRKIGWSALGFGVETLILMLRPSMWVVCVSVFGLLLYLAWTWEGLQDWVAKHQSDDGATTLGPISPPGPKEPLSATITGPPSEQIKTIDVATVALIDVPRAQKTMVLQWTRENCSSVSVTNLLLHRVRRVRVVLTRMDIFSDLHQRFIDGGLEENRFPAELVGGNVEAVPEVAVQFTFINTVTPNGILIPLHYPTGGNRELPLQRRGRWKAYFTILWGEKEESCSYEAEFDWRKDAPLAGAVTERGTASATAKHVHGDSL